MPAVSTDAAKDGTVLHRRACLTWIAALILAACAPLAPDAASTTPPPTSPGADTATPALPSGPTPAPALIEGTGLSALVAFIKDGDIHVWDEATGQSQTILSAGDVIAVTMSDDGQVVAFLRRSVVRRSDLEWYEQSALWAVGRNGENPHELVSAEGLRALLGASETESSNIAQMAWIPGTHRLLFSEWRYIVQAEGESHAVPEGLYAVDVDTGSIDVLIPAGSNLRFAPSPDGAQIALMSLTGLSFVDQDGGNLRQDVLTYSQVGMPTPLFPTGVWTEDSRALVITGSLESDLTSGFDFTLWRVPVDGSAPEPLADIRRSHPGSVTFSPDGQRAAFIQYTDQQPPEIDGWFITPLAAGVGPLAIPHELEIGYANIHWSPAGDAFTGSLLKLCPDATSDSNVCESPISFSGSTATISWIDGTRFLLLTRSPSALFLGRLDVMGGFDATTVPIVAWPLEEWTGPYSFAVAHGSR